MADPIGLGTRIHSPAAASVFGVVSSTDVLLASQYAIGSRPISHTQAAFQPTIQSKRIYCITKDQRWALVMMTSF